MFMNPSPSILEAIDSNSSLALRSRHRERVAADPRERKMWHAHFVTWSCRAADLAADHRIASIIPFGWWTFIGKEAA
jgi:hypothetical protein